MIKERMRDAFDDLSGEHQDVVYEIVAQYHARTGKQQADGSLGEIQITLKELKDCLAYCLIVGMNDGQLPTD